METEQFIGLTKEQACYTAEKLGLMVHLVRRDEKILLGYPEDKRDDRICLEFDRRRVTKAVLQ